MKLVIASGKGGTGKTTVATNLAVTLARRGQAVTYVDCDVEAPNGTACPMMETVRDGDYVMLVTEPTPFGLHDLRLALETAKGLKLRCGVVVNRAQPGANETRELCASARVPVLAEIPDDMNIAKAYSQGRLVVEALPELKPIFKQLGERLRTEAHN